jgi:hypothetical protein
VAISEAARKLLAGRNPAAPNPPPPKAAREPDRTGYRERAQREAERFRLATDSEYWLAFCFRTPAAQASFAAAVGADGRYVPGPRLPAPTVPKAGKAARMLAARSAANAAERLAAKPPPSPLEALGDDNPTVSLEQASADELAAIHAALTAPRNPRPPDILDSPHWVVAYWPHRDAKDEWLAATGVDVLGDKYLDGHQAARALRIRVEG